MADNTTEKASMRPLIIFLLFAVAVAILVRWQWPVKQPPEGRRVGDKSPEITGFDMSGSRVSLSDYRGKVVLVSFWGTWCAPCVKLLPREEQKVVGEYKDRPFAVLGVALRDSPKSLRAFSESFPISWSNIADERNALAAAWGIDSVPSAILIDHEGIIRGAWLDGLPFTEVWDEVEKYVRKAEGK